jgi:hypothetical protein
MTDTSAPRPPARRRWLLRVTAVGSAAVLLGSAMTTVAVVSSAAATPLTLNASADAYVAADAPDTNFGAATNLTVRAASSTKPEALAYVRFTVTGLTRPPSGVSLQLYSYAQTASGVQVYTSGSDWTESGVTWNTAPARGTTLVANMQNLVTNQYAAADVSSVVTGNGTYTFAITTTSTLSKQFASREVAASPPRMLISTNTPDTVTATAGSGQSAAVSTAYASPLKATVTDGAGSPVANVPVTFTAPASGASASFAGGSAAVSVSTDAAGIATTPELTANATAGTFQVSATTTNGGAPAAFTLTNGGTAPPTTIPPTTTPPATTAPPTTSPPVGTSKTYTFKATADSYVRSDQPDSTHGAEFVVNTQAGSPTMTSYLHFTVAGVTGTVTAANLQLYSYSTSPQGVVVSSTTSGWTEAGLTFNNAPAVGAVVGNGPNIVVNTLASVDITGAVAANAGYDFALTTARTAINKFASRESSTNQPTLVVTAVTGGTTPPTTTPPTTTPPPTSASPTVGSPTPTVPAGSGVTAVGGSGQHAMTGAVFAAPLAAKVVNASGAPVVGTPVTFTAPATGATATFPGASNTITVNTDGSGVATTPVLTAGATTGAYVVTATAGAQSATFALTNADPTIVAGGDIACTAGKAVTTTSCQQQATSDLALSLHPDALLPLGDDQYELGSLSDFQSVYGPTWGRMNGIAHPVPGNHEYGYIGTDIQPTGGAGYFQYFGDISHPLAPGCTISCTSWYSWNIGSWHMIALDSQCGEVKGCNNGNPQYQWLLNDLNTNAQNPATSRCVLAYWHIPLFSSSQDHQPDMQAIYNLLTSKGADVVLNGHAHFYERFNPQDGTGAANANAPAEFIVGSGGRNFFSIRDARSANSAIGIANTFGVLQMTLSSGSYSWNFATSNAQGTPDSGTASCH